MEQAQPQMIVGIDLGTTHSLVAVVQGRCGHANVLQSTEGKSLIPSVVSWSEDDGFVVGAQDQFHQPKASQQTIFSIKRLLGRSLEDLESLSFQFPYEMISESGLLKVRLGDKTYTPIEISAMILRRLKTIAEQALGQSVHQAVVTVPAYFNDAQRQATRTAGRLAGWNVVRILNEPTAAALAYGWKGNQKEGLIAVYDLGGGTFDLSILRLKAGIFEVLSTHGDTALGGDDFDQIFVQQTVEDLKERWGLELSEHRELYAQVLQAAEKTKCLLSEQEEASLELNWQGYHYFRTWIREDFEQKAFDLLKRTEVSCLQALQDAKISIEDLSDVVLVGGATRMPCVRRFVEGFFQRKPNTSLNPDTVVAQGAAIQADILQGHHPDCLLLDVVPLSLGIETYGGLVTPLITRNTRIPVVARDVFTTSVDFQTGVEIHVLQGERDRVEHNRSLAHFHLKGIEPLPAGQARVEVTFCVDADSILQVTARDLRTQLEQSIEVRPSYGLTEQQVEQMLQAGLESEQEDRSFRQLTELKQQADRVIDATEKGLQSVSDQLTKEEVCAIQEAVIRLKKTLQQKNPILLQGALLHLNRVTIRLAECQLGRVLNSIQILKNSNEEISSCPK